MDITRLDGRIRRCSVSVIWVLFLVLLAAVPSFSQATGTILGVVKDSSGAVVPQASVTVINTDTNESRTAKTGDDGAFRFPALTTGHYSLKIEKDGFTTQTQTGLTLEVTQELVLNPSLQVGTSTQEVTVTGEAPVVNTTNSSLGGLVDEGKMSDLPLNGRNYVDLVLMQTGVVLSGNVGASDAKGGTRGEFFSVDGMTIRGTMFYLDGAVLTNGRGSTATDSGTTLGVDGIKEFKVVTGTFGAEYGIAMGGQAVMVSKGGTNQFHGNLFDYLRNSIFDARNFFDFGYLTPGAPRLPHFDRNNFGGSVGGPIKKDKTFFYGVYEGLRQRLGQTLVDVVPAAACHSIAQTGPGGTYQFAAGGGNTAAQNATACGSGLATTTAIPAQIPPLLALFPTPNLPNSQYTFPSTSPSTVNYGQMRVDQNISTSDTLFGRYTVDQSYLTSGLSSETGAGVGFPLFTYTFASRNQFLTLGENHIFSPTVLNTVHISYSRTNWQEGNVYQGGAAAFTGPQYSFVPGVPMGDLSIGGLSTFGANSNNPEGDIQNLYQLTDDVFYTKGKHALKFGVQAIKWDLNLLLAPGLIGTASFSNIAGFLTGVTSASTAFEFTPETSLNRSDEWYSYGFYAQDDWRVSPRLTLNLGLRYEFMTQMMEKYGKQAGLINPATATSTTPGPQTAPPSKDNFSPRVGFAWDVQGNGKTSVRGGAGLYSNEGNISAMIQSGQMAEAPITQQVTGASGQAFTVPLTFTAAQIATPSLKSMSYNFFSKIPDSYKWTLSVDRQLPMNLALTVSYVGTRSLHMIVTRDFGPTIPSAVVDGYPYYTGLVPRPNPHFGSPASFVDPGGSGTYNALDVSLNRRLDHGLETQFGYTYSHSIDDTSTEAGAFDCNNSSGMTLLVYSANTIFSKGPSCFDVRHSAHFNMLYYVPSMKSDNFAAKALRGWWLSNVVTANTGYPFTPMLSTNRSRSGNLNNLADYANVATAANAAACPAVNVAAGCAMAPVAFNSSTVIQGNPEQWYNPNMFVLSPITTTPGGATICTTGSCPAATPGFSTLGDVSRGLLRGPGLLDWDFAVSKDTALPFLGEQGKLQFRAEIFNIINHANLGMPNGAVLSGKDSDFGQTSEAPSSSAGVITTTVGTSRQIQFTLGVVF